MSDLARQLDDERERHRDTKRSLDKARAEVTTLQAEASELTVELARQRGIVVDRALCGDDVLASEVARLRSQLETVTAERDRYATVALQDRLKAVITVRDAMVETACYRTIVDRLLALPEG